MTFQNTLYTQDNLFVLKGMNSNFADLIYLDPPFNSKRLYSAPVGSKAAGASFKDMWTWQDVNEYYLDTLADNFPTLSKFIATTGQIHSKAMMAYLTYMAQRIIEMHRVLKDTGSIYLHCDPTASHYLKVLLDEIFGKNSFRNEIIWCYRKWNIKQSQFPKNHDVILFYSKNEDRKFHSEFMPKSAKSSGKGHKIQSVIGENGKRKSVYLKEKSDGTAVPDWWEIPIINPMAKERVGYPTQKPLALLRRIIMASSNEGDVVFDPFCGCATACVAAQQLNRKWIGIDIAEQSAHILVERLNDDAGLFKDFINTTKIPKRTDIEEVEPSPSIKEKLYEEQNGKCKGCGEDFKIQNLEIDHIIPKAKGGHDYYENYQLLCGSCNRIKGARPMEYLRMKIETRERLMKTQILFGD